MFLNKSLVCGAAILGFLTVGSLANAEDASETPGRLKPRGFESEIRPGEIMGWEQVRRVLVASGTNQFIFIVPHQLRISATSEKVTLAAADNSYFLSFRILGGDGAVVGTAALRRQVLEEYPRAAITDEFSKTAAGREGPVFSLRENAAGRLARSVRVALIPSPVGTLEFSFNASTSKATEAEAAFNSVLRTFRSNERGKLELIGRVLDKS